MPKSIINVADVTLPPRPGREAQGVDYWDGE